ncbi:MAG TPA: cyanophycin synthetase, partial [Candidatus Binataceae bacterium]|nr:cyanophycin synthetase [Candidatus Binataceae bacterium]
GRMEAVRAGDRVTVLVDYAHKPDALEAVLRTVRRMCKGRVICVFGCGGDRDPGKRPIMGRLAAELADLAIVTSDNPRSEDPLAIIAQIEAGVKAAASRREYRVEPDRRRAIGLALGSAQAGDAIVIAGKGHENYQLVGKQVLHFDDREVVRELTRERGAQP